MTVEAKDEVLPENKVEDEVDPLTAPEIEDEAPNLEPEGDEPTKPKGPHPLKPGGMRFEQVYAKGKQAERDLAHERELRIAAEAKLEVLTKTPGDIPEGEVEYDWPKLEEFIAQGRITRADAEAHRELVRDRKLTRQIADNFEKKSNTVNRNTILTASIAQYVDATPAIMVEGSEDRVRCDEEFDWLASVQGVDASKLDETSRKALQLTALRNVYGPIDSVLQRTVSTKTETHQGLPGGNKPRPKTNPDQALLDGLTKREVRHYTKMMESGRYKGGWKEVVAELKYVPPKPVSR